MNNDDHRMATAVGTWAVAALGSAIAWILLMLLGGWSFLQATFVAIIVFAILLVLALWIMRPLPALGQPQQPAKPDNPKPASKPAPVKTAAAAAAPVVQPSAALSGQSELAERKGEWKYEGDAAPAAETKPAKKPVAADGKPELFTAPNGDADDLKLISGVGPKLEGTLNELGVWHFSQVAGWRKKEIAWVDERLKFKGRIERDDWIGQAKILAKGGETEFSKRKKK